MGPLKENKRQACRARFVASCCVPYEDIDGIDDATEVNADNRQEAVELAVSRFEREEGRVACPPGFGCDFQVKVLPEPPIIHTMSLKRIGTFARHGTVTGPCDILRKQRIRKLLGIEAVS